MDNNIHLIDGGLSTELVRLGYNPESTKLWTGKCIIDRPDILKQAHLNFLNSGSEIITTGSYQLSLDLIKEDLKCSDEEAKNIIRKSVSIAKEAVSSFNSRKKILVAGSIGPYGACLCDGSEFRGDYVNKLTIEYLIEWHRPRLECLIQEGCDLLAFETMPSIKEATALVKLLAEYPQTEAWLSFSCRNETELSIGEKFKDAYEAFKNSEQLIAIGINCTYPKHVTSLLESVIPGYKKEKPFIVYSNDAKKWDYQKSEYVCEDDCDPIQVVLDLVPKWISLGVQYIGGCCNISSENIKQINKTILNNKK